MNFPNIKDVILVNIIFCMMYACTELFKHIYKNILERTLNVLKINS